MKLYDVNVFDWGIYNGEDESRVTLDAYPVYLDDDGYYATNASVDPIRLELTNDELLSIGFVDTYDTWIHSDALASTVETLAPRVYTWLKSLPDTKEN